MNIVAIKNVSLTTMSKKRKWKAAPRQDRRGLARDLFGRQRTPCMTRSAEPPTETGH